MILSYTHEITSHRNLQRNIVRQLLHAAAAAAFDLLLFPLLPLLLLFFLPLLLLLFLLLLPVSAAAVRVGRRRRRRADAELAIAADGGEVGGGEGFGGVFGEDGEEEGFGAARRPEGERGRQGGRAGGEMETTDRTSRMLRTFNKHKRTSHKDQRMRIA
jgi:hypothetical protein